MTKPPFLFIVSGVTGSGKSEILSQSREFLANKILVAKKHTTRKRRINDNDWEFEYHESLPITKDLISYNAVGNDYALDLNDIYESHSSGKHCILTCTDTETIDFLSTNFNAVCIFVYRNLTRQEIVDLCHIRNCYDYNEIQHRINEADNQLQIYNSQIKYIDHTILNTNTLKSLHNQLYTTLDIYNHEQSR